MTTEAWIVLGVLAVMFVLLIWDRFPAWLVFMDTLAACMTLGLAEENALLKGFSNRGVITVAALFPVAAGMYATGAITLIAEKLIGLPKSLRAAQIKILPPVAVGSAFLNNTPLVAMMIPVIRDLSRTTGLAVSRLLMPMSFASILGGASTLIGTSTNLIIAGMVADSIATHGLDVAPVTIFAPTKIGLPAAIVGILFLIFVGIRLLPSGQEDETVGEMKRLYRAEFLVEADSNLDGKTLERAGLSETVGFELNTLKQ
ncbi:MAG: SLC13 family permease [Chloroflexota bacterium]|nr:SLC13 family permease [Chloroflexota bacterium]